MNKINSLYELIKQKSKEKGRTLKILCDWDDSILPVRPWAVYHFIKGNKVTFKEFFERFWDNVIVEPGSIGGNKGVEIIKKSTDSLKAEERAAVEEFIGLKKRRKSGSKEADFYSSKKRYQAPFLSIAEQLLQSLKEDLIDELFILSAYRKSKKVSENQGKYDKFSKTFGKFSNCKITIYEMGRDAKGGNIPHRNEWIKDNYPQFDFFIDDNHHVIKSTSETFSDDKIMLIPDLLYSRNVQAPNIYHVKTTVSDLKDEDFAIVALEKNLERLEKEIKQETEKGAIPYSYLPLSVIISVIFLSEILICLLLTKKNQKKKKVIIYGKRK